MRRSGRDLLSLGEALSQSLTRVDVSAAVLARIAHYLERMPDAAAKLKPRHADMPYRKLLTFIFERLWAMAYADCYEVRLERGGIAVDTADAPIPGEARHA